MNVCGCPKKLTGFYPDKEGIIAIMAISFPSVCVPRVTMHSKANDVKNVFNSIFGGDYVSRVDMQNTTDSKGLTFQMVFVHFKQDVPPNEWTEHFYQKLNKDTMVKVMTGYKEFYWKVYYNQSSKKDQTKKPPHIMTPEEEAEMEVNKALKAEVKEVAEAVDVAEAAKAAEAAEVATMADLTAAMEDVVLSTVD